MAEYFYSKNQKQKAKEFFNKIISYENSNQKIKTEAQKKLNRDFNKYYSLSEAEKNGLEGISKLPKSLKVLLENLLRYEDEV